MTLPEEKCIAWWKFEDRLAEIGDDLTEVGAPSYDPGEWNNGFYSNIVANYLKKIGETFFTPNVFIVEQFLKCDFNIVNGVAGDGAAHNIWQWYFNNDNRAQLEISNNPAWGSYLTIRYGGANNFYFNTNAAFDVVVGTNFHYFLVYDRAGIAAGANRVRMYFEGANIFNSAVIPANQGNTNGTWVVGIQDPAVPSRVVDSVIDNMKIYNEGNCYTFKFIYICG